MLSGRLIPVALMPSWTRTLADWLPFESTFGFPITALVGPITGRELAIGLLRQVVWTAIGAGAVALVWRRAREALHGGQRMTRGAGAFRVAALHARVGVMNELQYRANFLLQLLESAVLAITGSSPWR